MRPRHRTRPAATLALCAGLLALSAGGSAAAAGSGHPGPGAAAGQAQPRTDRPARPQGQTGPVGPLPPNVTYIPTPIVAPALSPEALRRALLEAINVERQRAKVPPLAAVTALDRVAQQRAEELGKAGKLTGESESFLFFAQAQRRIRQEGYHPHGWTESVTVVSGQVPDIVDYWKGDASFSDAMSANYRDAGIGISRMNGVPLYTFLFAWPERDFFARETAPLADLAAVRGQVLAAVNAARREAGLDPLVLDETLNRAAQAHADDMLARGYYAHASPEGSSPLTRTRLAGYASRRVGENIAAGIPSVAQVMSGWLGSSGHRKNILDGAFTQLGVGLAVGQYEDRYRLLWVQDFGTPAAAAEPSPPAGAANPTGAAPNPP